MNKHFRRISSDLLEAGISYIPLHERDDIDINQLEDNDLCRVLVDVFSTRDGNWNSYDRKYDVSVEMSSRYLKTDSYCKFDDPGGATHLFMMLLNESNEEVDELVSCNDIHHGQSGFIVENDDGLKFFMNAKKESGWANMFMNSDSAFYPGNGEKGVWTATPFGNSDSVTGLGLINRWHISIFMVFEIMTWAEYAARFLVTEFGSLERKIKYYCDNKQMLSLAPYTSLQKKALQGIRAFAEPLFAPVTNEIKVEWKGMTYICQKFDPITVDPVTHRFTESRYYYYPIVNVNDVVYFSEAVK